MSEQVGEELSDHVDVAVGLRQLELNRLVQFIDHLPMNHQLLRPLHVPFLQKLEVLALSVTTQLLNRLILTPTLVHIQIYN